MAVRYFTGFETGDASEIASLQTGMSIQGTTKRTGSYALKCTTGGEGEYVNGLNASTVFVRFALFIEDVSTPGTTQAGYPLILRTAADGLLATLQLLHGTDGGRTIQIQNQVGGTVNIGSAFAVVAGQQYVCEVKCVISATVGILELKVDGSVVQSGTGLNTGSTNVDKVRPSQMDTGGFTNFYIDDVLVDDAAYPGNGKCIARQGKAGAPNADAWTKSSGTSAAALWSDTPFNATSECHSTAQNQAQTMLVADVGAGTDPIGSGDTINACRVFGIGKLRAGTNKRTYSVRRRINATNTDESVTALQSTAGDAPFYSSIFTTTLALLQSAEIGGLRGATTSNSQEWQIEDMWLMVDYTPSVGRQTKNTRSFPLGTEIGMNWRGAA